MRLHRLLLDIRYGVSKITFTACQQHTEGPTTYCIGLAAAGGKKNIQDIFSDRDINTSSDSIVFP